ncbi:hypothetical protein D3C78_1788240 [compost metagenome]
MWHWDPYAGFIPLLEQILQPEHLARQTQRAQTGLTNSFISSFNQIKAGCWAWTGCQTQLR